MSLSTIEFLHREHQEWLKDADSWEIELKFLSSIIEKLGKKQTSESQKKAIGELQNKVQHHQNILKNLKSDIHSHERFISEMINEDAIIDEDDYSDHDKHRRHVLSFKNTLKELRIGVFKLAETIL